MNAHAPPRARRGPPIGALILLVNVVVLAVPLLAVFLLQIYEAHLVETTERRLIAESVLIGEAWRDRWLEAQGRTPEAAPSARPPHAPDERFHPIEPVITLDRRALPPAEPAGPAHLDETTPERRAGRAIKPLLDRAKVVNLSGARVLDTRGVVIATTGGQLGEDLSKRPEVAQALTGTYFAIARQRISDEPPPPLGSISRRGRLRLFTATPIFSDGQVVGVVRMSRTSLDPVEVLWSHRRGLLLAAAGCLALTLALTLLFARTISRPVRALRTAAEAIIRGEPRQPFRPGGLVPAELQALSDALDVMTGQLTDRADYIAEFAANVSHELKTPLTGITGAAELLRDEWAEMPPATRDRFLSNIDLDARRMERLVTRLLHLARIQSEPAAAEPVEVRPFLESLVERHGARVRLTIHDAPARITIHRDHLDSAVRNLVENALRHGEGEPVEITADAAEGRLRVRVRDRGPGISEGNRERIFQRFFTTERDRGGTGLGLSIVEAVARTRGGSVAFDTGPDGTTFTLVV